MATPVKYRNGLIGTILFHGMIMFLLLYMAFRTPLPLPAEQGILVDFGSTNTGFGNYEPPMSDPAPVRAQPQPTPAAERAEEVNLTQDIEEAVALPEKKKPKETPKETKPAPKEVKPTTKPVEQPKPIERSVNQQALYPGRGSSTSTAASQGEAGGQGNQGVSTGAPDVHVYGEGGDSGGNGFALSGRALQGRLPIPEYKSQEQGKVVVDIIVDKNGTVTKATAGAKGSTTLDKTLLDAAEKAARSAKFNRKPDSPEQHGTITYIFKIQGE